MTRSLLHSVYWLTFPSAALLAAACGSGGFDAQPDGRGGAGASAAGQHSGGVSSGGKSSGHAGAGSGHAGAGDDGGADGEAGSAGSEDDATGGVNGSAGGVSGSATAGRSGTQGGAGGTGAGGSHAGAAGSHAGAGGSHAGAGGSHAGAAGSHAGAGGSAGSGGAVQYLGPSVGAAKSFAVLAYSAITAANISPVIGDIGVSAGAVSTITGFDSPLVKKFGLDSLAPNDQLTTLAQQAVTALVGNIDPRPCDADYTNVVGGLTGDITLNPGVTCMNSFSSDVLLNGHLTLDAHGDPNAFFIIRGNLTLTVADAAQVILSNGAQACGVFWRISKQVTIGKTVQFYGNVIAGSAITMKTGSTLVGRALARTEGVQVDANTVTVPSDGLVGSAGVCTHMQ